MSRSSGAFGCAQAPRVHERVGLRELPQPPYIPPVLFFYAVLHLALYAMFELFSQCPLLVLASPLGGARRACAASGALAPWSAGAGTALIMCGSTCGVIVFCVCAGICLRRAQRETKARLAAVVLGIVLALVFSLGEAPALVRTSEFLRADAHVSACSFELCEDSTRARFGSSYNAQVRIMFEGATLPGRLILSTKRSYLAGTRLRAQGKVKLFIYETLPSAYERRLLASGVVGSIKAADVELLEVSPVPAFFRDVRVRALELFAQAPPRLSAFLSAGICGYKAPLMKEGSLELFRLCGVSHVVCVSGAHLVLVSSFVMSLLKLTPLSGRARLVVSALACVGYVLMCGAPISAVRACLLVLSSVCCNFLGVKRHALSSIAIVGALILMFDPWASHSVSFMLSVVSVIALCVYTNYALYLLVSGLSKLGTKRKISSFVCASEHASEASPALASVLGSGPARALSPLLARALLDRFLSSRVGVSELSILAQSLVCQCACFPLTILIFGTISPYAPLANCFAVQLVMFALMLGFAALLCAPLPAAIVSIYVLGECLCNLACALLSLQVKLPCSSITLEEGNLWVSAMCAFALWLLFKHWQRQARMCI